MGRFLGRAVGVAACVAALAATLCGQEGVASAPVPGAPGPAETLYTQLGDVGLDPSRVFHIRDASIDRGAVHITLNDGTIAFTQDVAGKVTGAFFEGDGEVLVSPPNRVERASMALFTGGAILEETFSTAYLRFNDQAMPQWKSKVSPTDVATAFVTQWNETARILSQMDALRLLLTFAQDLPPASHALPTTEHPDSYLHARIQGHKLGKFDVYYDTHSPEQVRVTQMRTMQEDSYYDTWTSFAVGQSGRPPDDLTSDTGDGAAADEIHIEKYKIRAEVRPPTELKATTELQLDVREGGSRTILFELSRFLKVERAEADEIPVEFIHNPALEGSRLAARGDDLVALVFPKPLVTGEHMRLRFTYSGDVLADAGSGLLYVGARGTWYPNRGLEMADFDLQFRYPPAWELVATGKQTQELDGAMPTSTDGVSRWVTEHPIPLAGFNLGKYVRAQSHAGDVAIDVYAARGVEKTFPQGSKEGMDPTHPLLAMPVAPSPAKNAQPVADLAAKAIDFFSSRFGPYPYAKLAITQMPGNLSQGWPGLIFLSSFSFLDNTERASLHMSDVDNVMDKYLLVHETAHQWWGDTVTWAGYRDQWLVEALANYSSLMLLESLDPAGFRMVMEQYRENLLETNDDGVPLTKDGPVTLGGRLSNSQFPHGYETISYQRGTWLLHMLRCMMRDAEHEKNPSAEHNGPDAFQKTLLKLRERYAGKPITTADVIRAFEADMPPSLYYEGHKSLDWFYQGWVNGSAIPRLRLQNVKFTEHAAETLVSGTIQQGEAPEDMVTSVPVYAVTNKRTILLGRVFADGPETPFHLKAPAGTRKIVLDPEQTVLTQVK